MKKCCVNNKADYITSFPVALSWGNSQAWHLYLCWSLFLEFNYNAVLLKSFWRSVTEFAYMVIKIIITRTNRVFQWAEWRCLRWPGTSSGQQATKHKNGKQRCRVITGFTWFNMFIKRFIGLLFFHLLFSVTWPLEQHAKIFVETSEIPVRRSYCVDIHGIVQCQSCFGYLEGRELREEHLTDTSLLPPSCSSVDWVCIWPFLSIWFDLKQLSVCEWRITAQPRPTAPHQS